MPSVNNSFTEFDLILIQAFDSGLLPELHAFIRKILCYFQILR